MNISKDERELLVRLLCEPGALDQYEKLLGQHLVDKLMAGVAPIDEAYPACAEMQEVKASSAQLEHVLTRPPAGLTEDELKLVRQRRASELVKNAKQLEAKLSGRRPLVFRSERETVEEARQIALRSKAGCACGSPSCDKCHPSPGYRGPGAVDCGSQELDCKSANCATHGSPFARPQ